MMLQSKQTSETHQEAVKRVAQEIRERRRCGAVISTKGGLVSSDPTACVRSMLTNKAVNDGGRYDEMKPRRALQSQIPILAIRSAPPNVNQLKVGRALRKAATKSDQAALTKQSEREGVVEGGLAVEDIDKNDGDNYLLCTNYVKPIYAYLFELESRFSVRPRYMDGYAVLTANMRAVLIEWLIQVHTRFNFVQETLFMAVSIIDFYLQKVEVDKSDMQLIGTAALYISAKFEEVCLFDANQASYVTNHSCSRVRILEAERFILKALNFDIARPLQITFLRRFSKAANATRIMHELAKYFLELMLLDMEMASVLPSLQAATAIRLAMLVLRSESWNEKMTFYTTYKASDLDEPTWKFVRFFHDRQPSKCRPGQLTSIVYQKYADINRGSVSQMGSVESIVNNLYALLSVP